MPSSHSRLRVAMVLDDGLDNPDGVQQYILDVGGWLKQQGHSVDYLVGQTNRSDIDGLYSMSRNFAVSSNGNAMSIPLPSSNRLLKQHFMEHKYDVLHVQTPYSPFMGAKCIKYAADSTAVIGTFHIMPNNSLMAIGNGLLGFWLRSSLKRFDKMLSVSSAAQKFARQTFRIDSEIVPNVVDYTEFNHAKKLKKLDDGTINILFMGRLVPRKGCLTLLEAVNRLASIKSLPKFRVVVCGKGPLDKELKKYVARNNLDSLVSFEGFVSEEDKPSYYKAADLAVFPSTAGESFGIVLIEAMSAGACVLAARNPGYASVMQPFADSLFEPKNSAELATKLHALMVNKDIRKRTASMQSEHAKNFDISVVGKKIIDIYNQALIKRRDR